MWVRACAAAGFSVILNGLDNLEARRHVNRLAMAADVPLVESGTAGYLGQVVPHVYLCLFSHAACSCLFQYGLQASLQVLFASLCLWFSHAACLCLFQHELQATLDRCL